LAELTHSNISGNHIFLAATLFRATDYFSCSCDSKAPPHRAAFAVSSGLVTLPLKQQRVVHLPEAALSVRCLGRFGGHYRSRKDSNSGNGGTQNRAGVPGVSRQAMGLAMSFLSRLP
jgi:hypothetical protein